ncbi:hypothetical protein HMPREF3120_08155 [Corynebacterium sp. HMSC11D10]|uniref:hypothetical protein n=1 Tax=Corynebacterium sp. HMSC11D10 TaxID=1581088 RepID=UPI0008A3D8A7|nr:hypothetical protein [Corynebacterium sp. HMSC11D10]OFU53593.1 hypothetical protein HMPREF3120_08155 [Corynebacterium sp. HMSC11D10]
MIAALIIAEVAFWGCLFAGLLMRYTFNQPRLGLWLLAATPVIDLLLLAYAAYDLNASGRADFFHGFSAFYVVFSVVFGRDIIATMDRNFSGKSVAPKAASEKTAGLTHCVVASVITALVLVGLIVITGKNGSFWLLYWLIAVVFTPLMWWGVERWKAHR